MRVETHEFCYRIKQIMRQNVVNDSYLVITYHHGLPIAAYLYLPRASTDKSRRSAKAAAGLVIDFTSYIAW